MLGTVKSAGTVIAGGVVSRTVTRKAAAEVSGGVSPSSVAVQLTCVVPIANSDPELGVQTGVSVASRAVSALTFNVTLAPSGLVASANCSVGVFSSGGVAASGSTTTGNSTLVVLWVL